MIPTPVSARERIFTPRSRSSQMLLMVSGQRRPMRSMATTTRVSPPARRASRRCHPRRSWVPVEPETPTSRNRFSQGTAAPEGWSSLGRWVHPQDPLLEPAAGADIAVDWCQDRSWPLQLAFMEQLPQRGSCSANRGVSYSLFAEQPGCSGRIVVVDDRLNPPVTPAKTAAASTGKVGELFGGRTGGRDCWAAGQLPFPRKRRRSECLSGQNPSACLRTSKHPSRWAG